MNSIGLWVWIANALTVVRFVVALVLPWVPTAWQFWLLLAGGLTDALDGWISRQFKATSAFGQIADPIADKLLVITALVIALRAAWMTWYELLGLAARDLVVMLLSGIALAFGAGNWKKLTPRLSGKVATTGQIVALLAVFWWQGPLPLFVWLAAALSIWSAVDYTWKAWQAAQEQNATV